MAMGQARTALSDCPASRPSFPEGSWIVWGRVPFLSCRSPETSRVLEGAVGGFVAVLFNTGDRRLQ